MAEFGENLKKARTEKGITQQTLADHLFVTRQAVSRWEGGSRYPDLMTAKKMSQFLDISLDELLDEEDVKMYPEKNAILDSSLSKGIQTAIMSVVFMCYLILSLWGVNRLFINIDRDVLPQLDMADRFYSYVNLLKLFALTLLLAYGMIMSIRDRLNPKIASILSSIFFGTLALNCLIDITKIPTLYGRIFCILVAAIYLIILCLFAHYFIGNKNQSPLKLYVICVLYEIIKMISFIYRIHSAVSASTYDQIFSNSVVTTLADMLFIGLLCYMVYTLSRKRKRAAL